MQRPDLVLIVLDTQRADYLSCYGHPQAITPHLDQFAVDSWRFARAIAPAQWTVPTHASLFTGRYPTAHTMTQMETVLPTALPTLAERLQTAGYHTYGTSNNPLIGLYPNQLDRGFDEFDSLTMLGAGLLTHRLSQPASELPLKRRLARSARYALAEMLGYSQETGAHRLAPLIRPAWKTVLRRRGGDKQTNAQRSLDSIAQRLIQRPNMADGQPLFAFANLMGAHVPYDPAPWAMAQFLSDAMGRATALRLLQKMNQLQVDVAYWLAQELEPEAYVAAMHAFYAAETATQDAHLGAFFTQLRAAGRYDDTVIAIVADHGDHLGDKARLNHAFGAYQSLTRVPLLLHDPRSGGAANPTTPVSTRRLFHTLLAAAANSDETETALDLIAHPQHEEPIFSEAPPLNWAIERLEQKRPGVAAAHGYGSGVVAVTTGRFKLLQTDRRQLELYDVVADPAEAHDLTTSHEVERKALLGALELFQQTVQPVADGVAVDEDDPALLQHLRDLGYIE